jgi:hypothetical protein
MHNAHPFLSGTYRDARPCFHWSSWPSPRPRCFGLPLTVRLEPFRKHSDNASHAISAEEKPATATRSPQHWTLAGLKLSLQFRYIDQHASRNPASGSFVAGDRPYGDTVFNPLQIPHFLSERVDVVSNTRTEEDRELVSQIERSARRCSDEVHALPEVHRRLTRLVASGLSTPQLDGLETALRTVINPDGPEDNQQDCRQDGHGAK